MAPTLDYSAFKAFAKGSPPPVKGDKDTTDDFQTKTIDWMKGELGTIRVLVWGLIAFHGLMYGDMKGLW